MLSALATMQKSEGIFKRKISTIVMANNYTELDGESLKYIIDIARISKDKKPSKVV